MAPLHGNFTNFSKIFLFSSHLMVKLETSLPPHICPCSIRNLPQKFFFRVEGLPSEQIDL